MAQARASRAFQTRAGPPRARAQPRRCRRRLRSARRLRDDSATRGRHDLLERPHRSRRWIMVITERPSRLRRALVFGAPIASAALLLLALGRSAGAQDGPPVLGVGNVVAEFDWTTESFGVFRALSESRPAIGGQAANVVIVDHPGDAPYAVTGRVGGRIE